MTISRTTLAVSAILLSLDAPTFAADCISADNLGPPGNYYGGAATFPSGLVIKAVMAPFAHPNGSLYMGTPQLIKTPAECPANTVKSSTVLATHASDLEFWLSQLVKRISIEYCDGAQLNNLSAQPAAYDFIGPLEKADGTQIPSTNGSGGLANVSVRETHAAMRLGTVEVSEGTQYVQFGGEETLIVSICVE
jgi:hypothetical protein